MKKKTGFWLVFVSVLLAFFLDALFGRPLSYRLSMVPLIGRIVGPPGPVVITTREVVASYNPQDFSNVADTAKSKISLVVETDGSQAAVMGAAANITSDGLFAAPVSEFTSLTEKYSVLLSDGRLAPITERTDDPRTGIVFFRASLQNVPVISLDDSLNLVPGSQVAVLLNSTQNYTARMFLTQISQSQDDVEHVQFSADRSSRGFATQAESLGLGSAIVDAQGNLVGIWSTNGIISSDVLQSAIQKYLSSPSSPQNFVNPEFGFSYQIVTKVDAQLLGLPEGAQVTGVAKPGKGASGTFPALAAKLQVGDVITKINGTTIYEQSLPEVVLETVKPGDQVLLTVMRGKDTVKLTLTASKE